MNRSVLVRSGALLAALVWLAACSKEATPSAEQPRSASPPAGESPAPGAAASAAEVDVSGGRASYSEQSFSLAIKPVGEVQKGAETRAEIELEAKAPFHINDKYPYKLRLADSEGLSYPEKIVARDKAKVEHMKLVMPVAFSATEPGKRKIAGVFHFSVCTDDKCLIEKRPLALEVDVK